MSKKVKQIIVYQIQAEKAAEFEAIKAQMVKESRTLAGLHSSTTAKSLDAAQVYIDTMVWDSKEAAERAMPAFEQLPTAAKFLGLFAAPPLYQHFMEFEPDNLMEG